MAEANASDQFRLSVITAHEPVHDNRWITERWRVVGVVPAPAPGVSAAERSLVYAGPDGRHYLWPGFILRVYKDETEGYRLNLLGKTPSVYVIGQFDENGELIPVDTIVDYVEADSRREAGGEVYPVPMPPEVYRWLEAFVVEHYVPPEPRMKRKKDRPPRAAGPRSYEPQD